MANNTCRALCYIIVSHCLYIFSIIFKVTYFILRFLSALYYKAMDFTMSLVVDKAGNFGGGWIAVLQRVLLRRLGFWNWTAYLIMWKFLELEMSELIRVLQASEMLVA